MQFDESRLAVNAFEMYENGWSLHTTFEQQSDTWNTKPPLLIWIQVCFMHLVGTNEWAIRLPSAIAVGLICCLLISNIQKITNAKIWGLASALILVTSHGFMGYHIAWTGDYDALLCLWIVAYQLAFYKFLMFNTPIHIYAFYCFLTLAILTKSVAGLLCLPALFIFAFLFKQWKNLFKSKHFYFGGLICITVVCLYYYLREQVTPGYFQQVLENEFGGRFLKSLEVKEESFWFYFLRIRLPYWIIFLVIGIVIYIFEKNKAYSKFISFCLLNALIYFIIISVAKTKHSWYDAPTYAMFAIIIGYVFEKFHQYLSHKNRSLSKQLGIMSLFFIIPYYNTINKRLTNNEDFKKESIFQLGYLLKQHTKNKTLGNKKVVYEGYAPQTLIYYYFARNSNPNFSRSNIESLNTGDTVFLDITSHPALNDLYAYKIIHKHYDAKEIVIYGKK